MGKKTYRSAGNYAKRGSQPKKKSPQKRQAIRSADSTSHQANLTGDAPTQAEHLTPATRIPREVSAASASYAYVLSDLKWTAIIAAVLFAILIVLAITL